MLEKILKHFLWSNGLGPRRDNMLSGNDVVYPNWWGGLGIKDIKNQGIALAGKCIFKEF